MNSTTLNSIGSCATGSRTAPSPAVSHSRTVPSKLAEAIEYAVFSGGGRILPRLVLAAARARSISGEFADYLRLKERLRQPPDHADDPISLYLDDMQQAFDR